MPNMPASSGGIKPSGAAASFALDGGGSTGSSSFLLASIPIIPASSGGTKSTAPPVSLAAWISKAYFFAD